MKSQKVNSTGHLYNDSKYAHFSQITEHNKHLFPLLSKTTPVHVILNKGDCLFIPKGWWHWVKSYAPTGRCISLNFWFPQKDNRIILTNNAPKKFIDAINDWPAFQKWTNEYLIEKIDPSVTEGLWLVLNDGAVAKRIPLARFIEQYHEGKEYAYLITPQDYEPKKEKHNAKILDILKGDFHPPFPQDMEGADANFWFNFGGVDTGLHFDDDDGLLCLVEGMKDVLLYPPSDSEYLYPYPSNPIRLEPHKNSFHYNMYRQTHPLDIRFTSAQILEVALYKAFNVAKIAKQLQEKYGVGRIVYGIKNMKGVVRFEFYFYGVDRNREIAPKCENMYANESTNSDWKLSEYMKFHKTMFPNDVYDMSNVEHQGLCIFSIDLTEEDVIKGITPNLNLYYALAKELIVPFILTEKTYNKNGTQNFRSIIHTDMFEKTMKDADSFVKACMSIGIKGSDIANLSKFVSGSPYKCTTMSLFNKGLETGIYFYGIAYKSFVDFLVKYDYPLGVISFVVDNESDISQLQIEIGFHFQTGSNDATPSRTAFYGIF
jgi:hypothetical protein